MLNTQIASLVSKDKTYRGLKQEFASLPGIGTLLLEFRKMIVDVSLASIASGEFGQPGKAIDLLAGQGKTARVYLWVNDPFWKFVRDRFVEHQFTIHYGAQLAAHPALFRKLESLTQKIAGRVAAEESRAKRQAKHRPKFSTVG